MENNSSMVFKLKRQFERLANIQTTGDKSDRLQKCNWWLENEETDKTILQENVHLSDNENTNEKGTIDNGTTSSPSTPTLAETKEIEDEDDKTPETKEEVVNDSYEIDSNVEEEENKDEENEKEGMEIKEGLAVIEEKLEDIFYDAENEAEEASETNSQRNSRDGENVTVHICKIIEELHETERSYIDTISKGIADYICIFDDADLPSSLRGQRNKIFGTIERIRDLHKNQILPSFENCEMNVEMLCQTIYKFIEDEIFYVYIQYAINKQISDDICEKNSDYFKAHQIKVEDKLGILSILVQPIQRLPRYKLLLISLLGKLVKQMETEDIKEQIAWCCKAEKQMSRLLETFNESMSINDIIGCNDLNLLHQGKFYKAGDFDITDTIKRVFKGRVFLFERCLVYTEIITDKKKYLFRGYFDHNSSDLKYKEVKSKFKLSANMKRQQQFTFFSDFISIQSWIPLIHSVRVLAHENDKRKIFDKKRRRSDIYLSESRSSTESGISNRSSSSSGKSERSSGSIISLDDIRSRKTIWYK